ncbi:ABC transporter permease subunit [Alloyangia pacifica]|uniref:ABC-type sugar transport system, permease component n=1 Tax=Alloyangia pacifica TaxID=311180 RepID=A0A1I6UXK9_9RHOB|nr:ABC transporter permease subunit [Alloyangia pacifica]SDI29743.1 ABC-type sugar transport system, permease component [Alloyangia pacifica]SFT06153.1 ABC-type sugar transport system, permease component [Alloyangia pacifica]
MVSTTDLSARPKPHRTSRRRKAGPPLFAYLATLPTLLLVALVVGLPLLYSLWLVLHRTNPITRKTSFAGLENFRIVLENPEFWDAFARTLYFVGFSLVGTTVIGLGMALLLNTAFRGRGIMRSVMLVPWAMAPISVGVLWSFIYAGDFGSLNALLNDLGLSALTMPWLGDGARALNLVALTHVWNQAPLTALMLLAGLQSMPSSLHRAAMLDGAGPVQRFYLITLPWLKPSLLFVSILTIINALMAFDIIWIMTRGGPGQSTTVFAWLGYVTSFQFLRFGEGAAILYILTALSFVAAVIIVLVLGPRRRRAARSVDLPADEKTSLGSHGSNRIRRPYDLPAPAIRPALLSPAVKTWLGRAGFRLGIGMLFIWSAVPVLLLLLMSLTPATDLIKLPASLVPSSVTLDNFKAVLFPDGGTTSTQAKRVPLSLLNSFLVGAISVLIAVSIAPFAGYVFARWPKAKIFQAGLWTMLFTRMTPALTLVLPFFVLFRMAGLLDTRSGLVIAHLSILLPLIAWMMKSTFEGVPKSLDQAAIIDGCSRFQMMVRVLLPVIRPGLVAAGIFGFLVSWNEFLFAMILTSTPDAQTIPVVLAGFLSQARFHEYGPLFAASVLSVLPPVIIAFVFQRYLVQGALSGAVKG